MIYCVMEGRSDERSFLMGICECVLHKKRTNMHI